MNAKDRIIKIVDSIENKPLRETCNSLIANPIFWFATAASKKHQAYKGGLVQHTVETLEIALGMAESVPLKDIVDRDVVIAGALWHDVGKIWDYQKNPVKNQEPAFIYTRHRWTIRHVSRSYHEFAKVAEINGVPEDLLEHVCHVILAHHGRMEWGSPIEPITCEAEIVNKADELSGRYTEQASIFRKTRKPSDWKEL